MADKKKLPRKAKKEIAKKEKRLAENPPVSSRAKKEDDFWRTKLKVGEAEGWVFYIDYAGNRLENLFKSRPDGSGSVCISNKSVSRDFFEIIEIKDGWVHYKVTEEYSEREEDSFEFDRYRDVVKYKTKADGAEFVEVHRSHGYVGTSD